MKYIFLLLLLSSCSLKSSHGIIQIRDDNTVYYGFNISNLIYVSAENCSCNKLRLKTDNGVIEKGMQDCEYLYKPDSAGSAEISMYKKSLFRTKRLGYRRLKVKHYLDNSNLAVRINNHRNFSHISKKELLNSLGLQVIFSSRTSTINITLNLKGYMADFIYKDVKKTYVSENDFFNDSIKKYFEKLENGDMIVFRELELKGNDPKKIPIDPYVIFIDN